MTLNLNKLNGPIIKMKHSGTVQHSSWLKYIYPLHLVDTTDTITIQYKAGLIILLSWLCALCSLYYSFSEELICSSLGLVMTSLFVGVPIFMRFKGRWKLCGFLVCMGWLIDNNLVATCSINDALALTFFQSLIPSYLLMATSLHYPALIFFIIAFFFSLPYENAIVYDHLKDLPPEEAKVFALGILETTNMLNRGHLIATFCLTGWMSFCNYHENMAISALLKQAEQAKTATEAFFAAVNHEFRSPLNTLLGSLDLLSGELSTVLSVESISLLRTALDCGEIISNLINNVLDVSKIKAGMFTPNIVNVQPRTVLHKILNIGKAQALPKGIKIELTIDKILPKNLSMDGLRFTQILMNLVSNAIKFTHDGFVKIHVKWIPNTTSVREEHRNKDPLVEYITNGRMGNYVCYLPPSNSAASSESEEITPIEPWELTEAKYETIHSNINGRNLRDVLSQTDESSLCVQKNDNLFHETNNCITLPGTQVLIEYSYEQRGTIVVTIEDSGIGITKEAIDKLFNPFQQADENVSKNYGGTGLGLWISKTIVEVYSGSIGVRSKEKEGSIFTINLPCEVHTEEMLQESSIREKTVSMKCLLVDSKSTSSQNSVSILEKLGVDTIAVDTPTEAIEIYKNNKSFDIVIVSMNLVEMTSFNLVRRFRDIERTHHSKKNLPIFVILTSGMKERVSSVPSEVNGYILEPMNKSEMLRILKALSKKKHKRNIRKALIVDDDKLIAQIIGKILEREGIPYLYSSTGEGAINVYSANPESISLILLDTHLDDITGYETATRIRDFENSNKLPEVPIISLSGMTGNDHEELCKASGFTSIRNSYLVTKPVKANVLVNTIKPYFG